MYFVKFALSHWMLILGYIVSMSWVAFKFVNSNKENLCLVCCSGCGSLSHQHSGLYRVMRPLTFAVGYIFGIPLMLGYFWTKYSKRRQQKALDRLSEARERLRQKELELAKIENERRYTLRNEWLQANKPRLYFNTIGGVTAVLLPEACARIRLETENARADELWDHKIMKLSSETILFVTKSGRELMEAKLDTAYAYSKVAGWFSVLQNICQACSCDLVRDETIFVPFINGAIVPLAKQMQIVENCHNKGSVLELIDKQCPPEFHPVTESYYLQSTE